MQASLFAWLCDFYEYYRMHSVILRNHLKTVIKLPWSQAVKNDTRNFKNAINLHWLEKISRKAVVDYILLNSTYGYGFSSFEVYFMLNDKIYLFIYLKCLQIIYVDEEDFVSNEGQSELLIQRNKGGNFLKKLWCCVSGRV